MDVRSCIQLWEDYSADYPVYDSDILVLTEVQHDRW